MEFVPYFFDASFEAWTRSLLADSEAGQPLFTDTQVWAAEIDGRIVGFTQFGKPSFHYDSSGNRYRNPEIGVIRQLYFEPELPEVGEALLEPAEAYCSGFRETFAFYHAFGMGCQAYHGKLHEGMIHVARLLQEHGFAVRHENVYYTLDVSQWKSPSPEQLDIRLHHDELQGTEQVSLHVGDQLVGSATVRYLTDLTGGRTKHVAYLTWIGVGRAHRRRGLGRRLLDRIVARIKEQGCTSLHTDTALTNEVAQRFYTRLGFVDRGITRDYVRMAADCRPDDSLIR